MAVAYLNLTDVADPANESVFTSAEELNRLMEEPDPSRARPYVFELVDETGAILTVGIQGDFGTAQHTPGGDEFPSYLVAVDRASSELEAEDMEFIVTGTPTPIAGKYRIPFTKIKKLVAEFVTTGQRSSHVQWEEIQPT